MQRYFPLLLMVIGVLFFSPLNAQKKELKTKFGKISEEEIKMASYSGDPSAMAVVLFDKGVLGHRYTDNQGFVLVYERHTRIKIFNKEALSLADIAIFHRKTEKVSDLKATAYNMENGKLVETDLEKDNIFEENLTKNLYITKFSIPAVKEGTIIEYKYTMTNQGGVGMLDGWSFQQVHIPTIWSEFSASVPTYVQYKKMSQGWEPYALAEESNENESINISYVQRSSGLVATSKVQTIKLDYTANKMHFIMENVPALKTEPFVNSAQDYVARIDFDIEAVYETDFVPTGTSYRLTNTIPTTYNQTWQALGRDMLEDVYGPILNSEKATEGPAQQCTAGLNGVTEKTAAVYEYIGKNFQQKDFDLIWKTQTLDALMKDRQGSATDLNLLFINMLRRVNVKSWPVLVSTTDNGRIMPFRVSTDEFNRVIAAVMAEDSSLILVDMAGFPNPIGLLAKEDLNGQGLLLKSEENIDWIPLQSKVPTRSAIVANLQLTAEAGLSGNVTYMESGYGAVKARKFIQNESQEAFVKKQFKDWFVDGTLQSVKADKADQWRETSLKTEFSFETPSFGNAAADKIYFSPMQGLGLHENPFKNPERKFHIDFSAMHEEVINLTFKIPAGYKVEEMPKGAKMAFGDNEITFDYFVESNAELVKINLKKRLKNDFIEADRYQDLQRFYSMMVAKMEEQVVLSKI